MSSTKVSKRIQESSPIEAFKDMTIILNASALSNKLNADAKYPTLTNTMSDETNNQTSTDLSHKSKKIIYTLSVIVLTIILVIISLALVYFFKSRPNFSSIFLYAIKNKLNFKN